MGKKPKRINREGEGRPNQPQRQQIRRKNQQQQQSNKKQIGMKKKKKRRGRRIGRREGATDNREEGKGREWKGRGQPNKKEHFFYKNAITKYNKQIYIYQNFIKETQKYCFFKLRKLF
jgi:hypothetical protein